MVQWSHATPDAFFATMWLDRERAQPALRVADNVFVRVDGALNEETQQIHVIANAISAFRFNEVRFGIIIDNNQQFLRSIF